MKDDFRVIPGTKGVYGINRSGEVKNLKKGKFIAPFRNGSVKALINGKRSTISVAKTLELVYSPGYVDDAPDKMENILEEIKAIQKRLSVLVQKIEKERGNIAKDGGTKQ